MEHFFSLPVHFNGEELSFQGRLATFGYSFKIFVIVEKTELTFEKDEEGKYRVFQEVSGKEISQDLIAAIIHALEQVQA